MGTTRLWTTAAPKLYITPQHIVFQQQPGRSYRLIYGQERAEGAQYDLGRRVNAAQMAAAVDGAAGTGGIERGLGGPAAVDRDA